MAEADLRRTPLNMRTRQRRSAVDPDWWYYEEQGGLTIVYGPLGSQVWLPISQLRAFIERHDREEND